MKVPNGRLVAAIALLPAAAIAQSRTRPASPAASTLQRADAAYDAGERDTAARLYAEVLAADSSASRAAYRLAAIHRDRPAEAIRLLRRYVTLEPHDPWGHLALADALSRDGRADEALAAIDAAARIAPTERDVAIGRARVLERAGRLDDADRTLTAWTDAHPRDAEAWRMAGAVRRRAGRERGAIDALAHAQGVSPDARTARQLAAARQGAAPRLAFGGRGSRDSDANATYAGTFALDALAGDRVRLGVGGATRAASLDGRTDRLAEGTLRLAWRPAATTSITGEAGLSRLGAGPTTADTTYVTRTTTTPGSNGNGKGRGNGGSGGTTTTTTTPLVVTHPGAAAATVPVARGRVRWRAGDGSATVDLRAAHAPLDATPSLLANRVTRTDASLTLEHAIAGPLRVRGIGQGATYRESSAGAAAADSTNARTTVGGGPVLQLGSVQLALVGLRSTWRRATTAGYFAPKRADVAELGMYAERELGALPVTVAVDAGAGMQRVQQHGAALGSWEPAGRLWTQVLVPAGGAQVSVEADLYRSAIATEAATSAASWRYAALSLGMRVPLR